MTVCKASAGTGKTYTLAAYYVGLLLSGEDYRSILAITFTNKATAEMSERIIRYLYRISQGEENDFLAYAKQFMISDEHRTAGDEQLRQRAGECFRKMLLDYDNVQIMTIDSFLQILLSGLAGVLKMSAGLNTELDIDHVIRQAVDQLLATDMSPDDRAIMEDYMLLKLDQESHWDVRKSLCAMAKELYNESVQVLDADGRILFDADAIARRREAIERMWADDEDLQALKQLLRTCNPETYNRYTMAAYERLRRSVEEPDKMPAKDRFRGVSEKSCNADEMAQATELAAVVGRRYNTLQLTIRFSRDMQLMSSLQALIQRNLAEANCALLARTAGTLSKALRNGDADFILEKAGIRFKHVLMDEFQDTSQLQWSVIRRLLEDVLAGAGHTLLIVGDIKQSIYRWRNGDWHIMDSLTSERMNELTNEGVKELRSKGVNELRSERINELARGRINERFTSLTRNFRSSEEVVKFNLSLFKYLIDRQGASERIYGEGFGEKPLDQFYQSDRKRGGYVRCCAFPKARKEDLAYDMFDQMERLLQSGTAPSDMMVLVREKKEAALICDLHAALADTHPLLARTAIVSADSYVLQASTDVNLIIAALKAVVQQDAVSAKYVELYTSSAESMARVRQAVNAKTPLYEAVCELIRVLLTDADGRYTGSETAYVNNLLDRTRAYVSTYGSHMDDFLTYWDDTMCDKPIPATATNAIRILTVHASKGLQAQTLFVPFCMWPKESGRHPQKIWCETKVNDERIQDEGDYVPIQDGLEMADSAYYPEYTEEHVNMRVDNLNMLYVALTRAEDNLFVSTAYPVTVNGVMGTCNHVGKYVIDFISEQYGLDVSPSEPMVYEAGKAVVKNRPLPDEGTEALSAELWANDDQVRFVQSQEGALYTDYGDEAYRRVARMDEGTLCHEIFAHLHKADELEAVLDDFESRGLIRDKALRDDLKTLISSAWKGNEQMRDWFTAPWELRLEEAIYMDERELRPDRVMINPQTNEAVVLDYKFGGRNKKYHAQVKEYMQALQRIGYSPVRGYLWYAREKRLEEI